MSNHERFSFCIEKMDNGAWIVGSLRGYDDYGRGPTVRSGFELYADAEKHALAELKRMMREYRDLPKVEIKK